MLRAHRQAWVWQDEWHGLSIEDIREIERKTAEELKRKMRGEEEDELDEDETVTEVTEDSLGKSLNSIENSADSPSFVPRPSERVQRRSVCLSESSSINNSIRRSRISSERLNDVNHIETIVRNNENGGDSEDEFFDCKEVPEDLRSLTKWNSMELVPDTDTDYTGQDISVPGPELRRAVSYQSSQPRHKHHSRPTIELADVAETACCPTSIFVLVVHGGSILDGHTEPAVRKSDVTTLRGAFESVMRQHYQVLINN